MSLDHIIASAPDPLIPGSKIQYAWDSVSLTFMLSCPRRYQYQIIDGLVPRNPNYAIALVFGILFHRGLEHYHHAKASGAEHEDAISEMFRKLLADPATATLPTADELDEAEPDPEDDGITTRNSKVRTRYHLFRALLWYVEHYKNDNCKTIILNNSKPAVEHSFRIPTGVEIGGEELVLCGHIDRLVEMNSDVYPVDYKTTKSLSRQFFQMFDLSHQFTGYSLAANIILEANTPGAIVDGIALKVQSVDFQRRVTNRSRGQFAEYFELLGYVARQAEAFADDNFWPMNTSACYFCDFKMICSKPPEYRSNYIKQHFFSQPGWNPLQSR